MAGDAKKLPLTSVVVVLAAFLAGAGTGAGLHASFGGRRHLPGLHDGRGRLPPFLEALKLEPAQRTAIEAVVTKYHPRFEAIFKENAPKMQALREEMDAEILPLLTERQRTIRAAIDWSVRLLAEDERRLFARLGVFAGGATLESVEEVCGGDLEVLDLLEQLVDRSLVQRRDGGLEPRFAMLETIRQYAAEQLAASGEEERVQERHRDWLAGWLDEAASGLHGPEQGIWLHRLDPELANLGL